jgi:hypothetical protein
MALRLPLLGGSIALTLILLACPCALAVPPAAGTQAGHPIQAAKNEAHKHKSSRPCNVEVPVIGGVLSEATNGVCEAAGEAAGAVGGLVGEAASAAGNGIMDALASWMIGAATQITVFVSREMQQTTTPQLESAWYLAQFRPMADLGAALSLLVAMIGLASAAIRRSPEALAATLVGMVRAGLGTGLVIPLTVIGLGIADQISSAVLTASPHTFWATIAHAWGTKGFGGFGSSALATLIALIEVFAGIFVWLELIVRNAAIYVAVLFFATTLAASIWPVLSAWPGRLGRLLLLFVILKPVALIVLSLAGGAAAAGLSFSSGVSGSVGTILTAVVIFALAAFAPWALMYLLAADAETAYMAAGLRAATGAAVADKDGPSVRSGGGLRNLSSQNGAAGGRASGGGGSPRGGNGGEGGGGGGAPSGGGGPTAGEDGAGAAGGAGAGDGALAVSGETIGAGSIGAAAAASLQTAPSSGKDSQTQSPAAQTGGAQGPPNVESAQESGAQVPSRERQSSQAPTGRGDTSPQAPGHAPVSAPHQDGDGAAGQERPGGSNGAPQTPRPSPGGAPRQPAETTTRTSPRRRPRRSPVLAGAGQSRPSSPQHPGDREE